jgi:hypothetical protein
MTAAQTEALNKAWELLTEHFDHCIVAYETDADDVDGPPESEFDASYNGGVSAAIGLCERTKYKLLRLEERD